ncbi:MAG TPA: cobyric acid synthase CobQ, partial [Devosiaceae bacterium]|nr:cobyric acid synthase CobQ [Devosiaceae bacterium]
DAAKLPAEDVLALDVQSRAGTGKYIIAVPRLPRIANFDDLDPLRAEPGVSVVIVEPGTPIPPSDLIILPGSKATRADLAALKGAGWDIDIKAHARAGAKLLGICGGYQMLGRSISDPDEIEGAAGTSEGLGLLDVETVLGLSKELRVENAEDAVTGAPIAGYHMHMGVTEGPARAKPFALLGAAAEGARSPDGLVMGTYLHGLFASDEFRKTFLGNAANADTRYEAGVEAALDGLAAHLEAHLDLEALLALAR